MTLLCFCHLRWNFVYQRPQHLLKRFARYDRVFFIEEPVFDAETSSLEKRETPENVVILVPHLVANASHSETLHEQQTLLKDFFEDEELEDYIAWYYTPMALHLADLLPEPALTIYDCMDELSAFKFAPDQMRNNERMLLSKADVVFTGGHSLFEAKKHLHSSIYPFPSSIDKNHFGRARHHEADPADQVSILHPRIGFFGVIDERFDIELVSAIAGSKPDWHLVIIGPVVKIDPNTLPKSENIHYLGGKPYQELPDYLGGWDVAMIPFAANESTRFISPTKTPEYLAGGVPVVSTPIEDVLRPYGEMGLTAIGASPEEFIAGIKASLSLKGDPGWQRRVADFLATISWDHTWNEMNEIIQKKLIEKSSHHKTKMIHV